MKTSSNPPAISGVLKKQKNQDQISHGTGVAVEETPLCPAIREVWHIHGTHYGHTRVQPSPRCAGAHAAETRPGVPQSA